jgi:HPt (histidine-containing phosphotransfer) domain-containing protein
LSHVRPTYIDGILSTPLDNDALVTAYLEFLSNSLAGPRAELAPCCEIDAAIDRLGGDVELYRDLVDRFLDDTAGIRQRLERAIESRDVTIVHSAAHSLKGLAGSVGAVLVAAALAELEAHGRAGDCEGVICAWQQFRIEMERTADELADYHRSSAATPISRPNG